jgi:hypothetical protein
MPVVEVAPSKGAAGSTPKNITELQKSLKGATSLVKVSLFARSKSMPTALARDAEPEKRSDDIRVQFNYQPAACGPEEPNEPPSPPKGGNHSPRLPVRKPKKAAPPKAECKHCGKLVGTSNITHMMRHLASCFAFLMSPAAKAVAKRHPEVAQAMAERLGSTAATTSGSGSVLGKHRAQPSQEGPMKKAALSGFVDRCSNGDKDIVS